MGCAVRLTCPLAVFCGKCALSLTRLVTGQSCALPSIEYRSCCDCVQPCEDVKKIMEARSHD